MSVNKLVKIYVTLLEEGTPTIRGTQAIPLGNDLYKLLPTDNYDPGDETWEFLPGSTVKAKPTKDYRGRNILLAFEQIK